MASYTKVKQKPVVWNNDKIIQLIEEYEKESELWDVTATDYYNKEKRRRAIRRIAVKLHVSDRDVVKKINNLRTYYSREVAKIRKARKAAALSGREGSYVSRWTFFRHLDSFLHKQMMPRQRVINIGLDGLDYDQDSDDSIPDMMDPRNDTTAMGEEWSSEEPEHSYANPSTNVSFSDKELKYHMPPRNSIKYRMSPMSDEEQSMQEPSVYGDPSVFANNPGASPSATAIEDDDDLFGRIVASGLKRIKNYQLKQFTKIRIEHMLYEAQFGVSPQQSLTISALNTEPSTIVLHNVPSSAGVQDVTVATEGAMSSSEMPQPSGTSDNY